jgi:hypothetical protein
MSEFIHFGDLSLTDLVSLNILRMHKKVIHKSNIVLCDGQTIKADMLTGSHSHSDYHKFPTQRPTTTDLTIWNSTICKLSSVFLVLTVKLQEYIGMPHSSPLWLLDNLGTTLHHNKSGGTNCTTRSISHCQIHLFAGPGLDNVLSRNSLPMDIPISDDGQP